MKPSIAHALVALVLVTLPARAHAQCPVTTAAHAVGRRATLDAPLVLATRADETAVGWVVLGVDVAKKKQLVSITTEDRTSVAIFKWSHPEETPLFTALCEDLRERGLTVEVAMEPSGTYGDAMRCKLLSLKFDVYQVAGKRVHDAAEVFDGVPSTHDAKAAVLIARLHLDKASKRWPMASATSPTSAS